MSDSMVFRLFADCVPVKGARRSLVCDLQNQRAQFIPNDLFSILTEMPDRPTTEIKARFDHESDATIDQYFSMLAEKGYGFWCDEPEYFPELDLSWRRPGEVTNAIIDVDRNSTHDYESIFRQLDDLGCQAVQIRAYDALPLACVKRIAAQCERLSFRHLEFAVKFHFDLTEEELGAICREHQVISRVVVHSSPFSKKVTLHPYPTLLNFHKEAISLATCGQVSADYFSITLDHFTEAQHFNTCLNRKISICADGEIRNCPSMRQSYGNTRDLPLAAAMQKVNSSLQAGITKDKVSVCKDCEFRYICTDCRAFVSSPDDPYSKPAKCSYDPYTATWADARLVNIAT